MTIDNYRVIIFCQILITKVVLLTDECHFLPCFFLVAVVIGDKSFAKPIRECLAVVAQDDSLLVETVLDIT